jgi:hypothetical protein
LIAGKVKGGSTGFQPVYNRARCPGYRSMQQKEKAFNLEVYDNSQRKLRSHEALSL